MTKTNQDVTLYESKDYKLKFTEADAQNLSTFNEITYAFADDQGSDSTIFTKTKSGGGITISGSNNEIADVEIDATDTQNLSTPQEYYHELGAVDSNGNDQTVATGTVTLLNSQT